MSFSISLSDSQKQALKRIWELPDSVEIIEMTAFGDFFSKEGDCYFFNSLTDACRQEVTAEINEFGLPPVSVELGDEWYQLDAQSALDEEGIELSEGQCFGFMTPLYQGGDYALENIEVKKILEYHSAANKHGLEVKATDI